MFDQIKSIFEQFVYWFNSLPTLEKIVVIGLILLLLFLLWLIFKLLMALLRWLFSDDDQKQSEQGQGQGQGYGQGQQSPHANPYDDDEYTREQIRRMQEEERNQKASDLQDVLSKEDSFLTQILAKKAGVSHEELKNMSGDRQALKKLADRLDMSEIKVLQVASTQTDIKVDVKSNTVREEAIYPTSDMEPVPMTDPSQMPNMLPEHYAQSDDMFYRDLADGQIMVMKSYESKTQVEILCVLLDVSGSMEERSANGIAKHLLARGIVLDLVSRAQAGKALIYIIPFDGSPHPMLKATSPQEAEELSNWLFDSGFSGGGTYIFGAFHQAVTDINADGGDFGKAEIVLVTDGEDDSMDDVREVKSLKGNNIRLHVVMVGNDNNSLKKVADSYTRRD